MSHQPRRNLHVYTVIFLLLVILSALCQAAPFAGGQAPTLDIGEEPPSQLPTAIPGTPFAITPTVVSPAPDVLTGPAPYPTPAASITPWEQLVNGSLIQDLEWHIYQGNLFVKESASIWNYSFLYPTGWYESSNPGMVNGFVQNIPFAQGPAPAEFVKFEVAWLGSPPMVEAGQTLALDDLTTVGMAGEPGILVSVTGQPDQVRLNTVFFQHDGIWVVAIGYINLPAADAAALDRYSAIILHIMSSFAFADQ